MEIRPFTIQVPQAVLDDLSERLARTRWPDEVAMAIEVVSPAEFIPLPAGAEGRHRYLGGYAARRRAEGRLLPRRRAAPVVTPADLPEAIPARRHEDQGTAAGGLPLVYVPDRQAWRAWLEEHHATARGVWLVYYKKGSGRPRVAHADAVEEALCVGWIDSRANALDTERSTQLFSPRKPHSPWSRLNKRRVEQLTAAGLMRPAGLAVVAAAKADGSWSAYDATEDLTVPGDLAAALAAASTAKAHFDAFPPSSKKNILWWIASAKRPETRAKRVAETVRLAAENKRANHDRT